MKLSDIYIRDPFILPYHGIYYMYGKVAEDERKFVVYTGDDLENWSSPKPVFTPGKDFWGTKEYWAPEVHYYHGRFYMFASFKAEDKCRGTHVLVSNTPDGAFKPVSPVPATPLDWECLDGTLYIDGNDVPYMVFSRDWPQVGNGTVYSMRMAEDLTHAVGEPVKMFSAHDYPFVHELYEDRESYVTDGPFLFRACDGGLLLTWSSFCKSHGKGYFVNVVRSDNGEIDGKWKSLNMLFDEHGGHGMIFRTFDGKLKLIFHSPNSPAGLERPKLVDIYETEGSLKICADNR